MPADDGRPGAPPLAAPPGTPLAAPPGTPPADPLADPLADPPGIPPGTASGAAPAASPGTPLGAVAHMAAGRVVMLVLAAATGVLIAHTLRPEGRGTYAIITTTALTAIVLGHLSVERTQIFLWGDPGRHHRLGVNALFLGMLLGTLTAAAGVVLTLLGLMPSRSPLLCLALLAVPFGVTTVNLTGIALLRSRMEAVSRCMVAGALVQCVPLMVLAGTGGLTVGRVIVCWTISLIATCLFLLAAVRPFPLRGDGRLALRQLALGSRYHVGLVACHLMTSADVLLLNALDTVAAVGLYTVAVTLLFQTRVPAEVLTQAALPRQAVGDLGDAGHVTARTVRLNLLVSSVFIGVLVAVSPLLIPLVYGRPFAGSVAPLLTLAPGAVALTLLRPVEQYLVRTARPLALASVPAGALVLNILLNVAVIPRWGAAGAGAVSTVTYALMAAVEMAWFLRAARLPVSALLPRAADVRSLRQAARRLVRRFRRAAGRTGGRTTPPPG
ncbi:polysaccharide biosynthesis C-terminal domain-containing protein [Sphaerisporangium sp. TRM90804]|uniref:lipopolysaccharide biosynthesis protein n=1 Tax=Sphaerisporangium sp. TRM90804 TaxID=3031113 RepID=UPI00244C2CF4|nr:polysaccharide biosynthesis C-terminal domain-containing protein [Sphaerisporangium sp. TRM90804]MDH2424134.1 polysaccharide biosynthesis C-terminal domain-containing protein [Sphaerisporangium sp. TRM90804]